MARIRGSWTIWYRMNDRKLFDSMFKNLEAVLQNEEFNYEKNQLLAEFCNPYVPMKTGALSSNINITPKSVKYLQPYASNQYRTVYAHHTTTYHPLATDHWQAAMMRNEKDAFLIELYQLIEEYNRRGASNL